MVLDAGRKKIKVEVKLSGSYQHVYKINCAEFLQCFEAPFSPTSVLVFISIFDSVRVVTGYPWRGKKKFFKNASVLAYAIKKLLRLLLQLVSISFRLQTLDENRVMLSRGTLLSMAHRFACPSGLSQSHMLQISKTSQRQQVKGQVRPQTAFGFSLIFSARTIFFPVCFLSLQFPYKTWLSAERPNPTVFFRTEAAPVRTLPSITKSLHYSTSVLWVKKKKKRIQMQPLTFLSCMIKFTESLLQP